MHTEMRNLFYVQSWTSEIYDPIPPCADQMTERALKHTLSIRTIAKSQCGKLLAIDGWSGGDRCRPRLTAFCMDGCIQAWGKHERSQCNTATVQPLPAPYWPPRAPTCPVLALVHSQIFDSICCDTEMLRETSFVPAFVFLHVIQHEVGYNCTYLLVDSGCDSEVGSSNPRKKTCLKLNLVEMLTALSRIHGFTNTHDELMPL